MGLIAARASEKDGFEGPYIVGHGARMKDSIQLTINKR